MQKIALLTDSACDLTFEQLKENNIKLAPLKIIYNSGEYEDIIEISADDVYEKIEVEVPKTSLPSNETIDKILNKIEEEGYTHVLAINISSKLSGTSNSIRLLLEDHPNLTSYVYDCKTLSIAEGAIVLDAAKLIKAGKSFEEIIEALPEIRNRTEGYFTLNTLEYLKKGGRIGKVSGTIGELLNLKPIIHVGDDGVYETYAKVRGRKQSISRLQKIVEEAASKGQCKVWVLNGGAKEDGAKFYQTIKGLDLKNIIELNEATVGPALGVHTGPGLLGVIIQEV
ncbi:MAG: DegV family protein [Clostridium sp.]|uniref:DegV family protein n=1 Tax=Clostridium TaxID=1485 RepID=UPI0021536EF7|nr:DegV family protein [Clostridium sp. LY3-2]MCR6515004.1 DegV family protein [Clostridium sp. LY3-2]